MVFVKVVCRLILLSGLGLGVYSCSAYRVFPVEVLNPAKVYLEPNKHIALLNRNLIMESSVGTLLKKYDDINRDNLVLEFANGMNHVFTEVNFFEPLLPLSVEVEKLWEHEYLPPPMNADSIRHLAEQYGLDYIAVVELQYYKTNRQNFMDDWFVRLYEAASGRVIDSVLLSGQLDWEVMESEELQTYILAGAWDRGAEYAQRIVPYWEQTGRRVYRSGKVLRLGDAFYKGDKIDEAEQVWQAAMRLSPTLAVRAAMNLAWLAENSGEFRKAADLLWKAREIVQTHHLKGDDVNYLEQYIRIMEIRISQAELLERQIIPEQD